MANDSEIKSLMTLSSKSEGSTGPVRQRLRNVPLHDRCSIGDMIKIRDAFEEAHMHMMLPTEFRELLRTLLNVEYDDEEFKILFLKINTSCSGSIEWDEVVSHLLLGYFGADAEQRRGALQPPILGLPVVMRSMHRHPISRIRFCPDVAKDRTTDPMQGMYVTASRDGMINWWTLDMKLLRTAYSASPHLKVRTTWVTDMVCLPDVNVVVTSSTERDLRFYDCTAKTFTLKIIITSWEYMICTMQYEFSAGSHECLLVLGDAGGRVRALRFDARGRGPFRHRADRPLLQLRHADLQRKPSSVPELQLLELGACHGEWVRQVAWYGALHCAVSCAATERALIMQGLKGSDTPTVFYVDKGVHCFAFDEECHTIATGSGDGAVRVWSAFVAARATGTLRAHRAAVLALVLQRRAKHLYSLARDRVIKVWDVHAQTCIQTYIDIPSVVGERTPLSAAYNPATRELILGAVRLAIVVLDEQINAHHTDGCTHARAVAAVLYNPLFKIVVTCGMDSIIINWDPVTGERNVLIREAHTRALHGAREPVELTAACFHPAHLLLLTGARDGSLKVWNFNTGTCLRSMSIEHMCEVTNCFWVEGRILAVGWNRHVTEFPESGTSATGKAWETRHSDDVLAAAARAPHALATATYNSELVLWKLETGQPYRRFSCTDPMQRIKLQYSRREAKAPGAAAQTEAADGSRRHSSPRRTSTMSAPRLPSPAHAMAKARARAAAAAAAPAPAREMRPLAVHAALFLTTRPSAMGVASLVVSLENGTIQLWSDHPAGGLQGAFHGTHTDGDYAASLATDSGNEFLFAGTTAGYVKVWLMADYLRGEEVKVCMPRLRLQFPFTWRARVPGRAARAARHQPRPLLLSSYRAHLRCITCLEYIDEHKLLLTGSSDYSVRAWHLSGQYVGTLGGAAPWDLAATGDAARFPPDVAKVASSTTLKVWRGGAVPRDMAPRPAHAVGAPEPEAAAAPPGPLLGRYFELPRRPERQDPILLDDSLPTIPLYAHLRMASTVPVRRAGTPPLVRATRLRRGTPAPRKITHFESDSSTAHKDSKST